MDIIKYVIICILIILLILFIITLLRTLFLRKNSAADAKVKIIFDVRAKEYGEKLAKMVKKETISGRFDSDKTKFYVFHGLLEEIFPNIHKVCQKKVFDGSLLFKWEGKSSEKPIMFMSHHDVVEATGKWKHEPFSGDIDEQGRVWGRGTVDTKASLFCMLEAVEELIAEGYEPENDIYISSSCTEEWGGNGATLIAEYFKSQGVRLDFLIDEGGMVLDNPVAGVNGTYAMIGLVEKGYGDIKFVARSNGGHANAPGKNSPLVKLGRFMAYVEKKNPYKSKFSPTVTQMFKRMAPNMDFGMKYIFGNMWLFKPLLTKIIPIISPTAGAMLKTTIAFTKAKGSEGLNVLPQEAYVTGNMRFIHHQPDDESVGIITKIASKFGVETEIICQDPPCKIVDYKCDAFKLVEQVTREIYHGVEVCPYVMTGSTDAKYYGDVCDACIRFAPLYIDEQQYESIHGLNENIYAGTLSYGVDFYKKIIYLS